MQVSIILNVVSVQSRCKLVLLVEPESYFQSITSSTTSGTIRCKHGAVLVPTRCSWWNQRAIFSQLGPPLFPVFSGEVGEAGEARQAR